MLTETG